jgi:hypothetical protein
MKIYFKENDLQKEVEFWKEKVICEEENIMRKT